MEDSPSSKEKRRFMMYYAITLCCEPVTFDVEIITNKKELDAIIKKIGIVYKDVKKNEESLNVDYLYAGVERSNLDKTIERLEKMNAIMLPH